jgi:hypothetical protein
VSCQITPTTTAAATTASIIVQIHRVRHRPPRLAGQAAITAARPHPPAGWEEARSRRPARLRPHPAANYVSATATASVLDCGEDWWRRSRPPIFHLGCAAGLVRR